MSSNQITLWNWLPTKSEVKNEIYCPPDLAVTTEQFAAELASQVKANRLPAEVGLYDVYWADTDTTQTRILIRYTESGAVSDVVRYLVGVDSLGAFTYVEEKVLLLPPELPETPREKKAEVEVNWLLLIGSLASVGIGIWGLGMGDFTSFLLCLVPGIFMGFFFFSQMGTSEEVNTWNAEAEREEKAWYETRDTWFEQVLAATSDIDGVFGRFTRAMSSTVKQVIKTLFVDHQAELRQRTEQEKTQQEIEELLEKRKREGFK